MWQETKQGLYKHFKFNDFKAAFAFMTKVAELAEKKQHHPKWINQYNQVEIWLSTHEAGDKITDKDRNLAESIDALSVSDKPSIETEAPSTPSQAQASKITAKELIMYADGGSRGNPGPSASGYVLLDKDDKVLVDTGVYLGITTNNQAEYTSLKLGLEEARNLGAEQVDVRMDSLLVVNQMKGIFKVKNRDLWPIHDAIKQLLKYFKHVSFTHVPRELNKMADAAVNRALDEQIKPGEHRSTK